MPSGAAPELVRAMGPVARELLGEPTEENKVKRQLRFGSRGSMAIDLNKGTWHDHEANKGGGVLDLVREQRSLDKEGAIAWLRERGHLPKANGSDRRQIAAYDYTTVDGELVFQVIRYEPKDFRQRRPDGNGGWLWKMAGVQRVIYALPKVAEAIKAGATVYIVEGEKAADRLAGLGLAATCSPAGANKWKAEHSAFLAGADVVILPDNDEPGRAHAALVAGSLQGTAASIRIIPLPGLAEKGDVADWIAAGGDRAGLEALVQQQQAEPEPAKDASTPVWVDADGWSEGAIPPRPWIARGYLLRGAVSVISGASSVSKSTLAVAYTVALALFEAFNRFTPLMRCRVLLYNVEDDQNEQRRRFSAVLRQFGVPPSALAGQVMRVGPNSIGTLIGRDPDTRELFLTGAMVELQRLIAEFKPDVLILDPLVELHSADENDNMALRGIMATFRGLAAKHDMAVAIVHHARKGASASTPGDPDTLRGASSIVGAARIVLTVAAMTEDEAKALGLGADQRRSFFRVDSGKSNYSRLHEAEWFERAEYELDNGDLVAAPVAWQPPNDAVSLEMRAAIEADIAVGSPAGPWAPKLSKDDRSIRQLFIRHGVTTLAGQCKLLADLQASSFETATYKRANRSTAQGLRTADGMPTSVIWVQASTCTDEPD